MSAVEVRVGQCWRHTPSGDECTVLGILMYRERTTFEPRAVDKASGITHIAAMDNRHKTPEGWPLNCKSDADFVAGFPRDSTDMLLISTRCRRTGLLEHAGQPPFEPFYSKDWEPIE